MKKLASIFVLVSLLLASCNTSNKFTKRKYTKGHYITFAAGKKSAPLRESGRTELAKLTPAQAREKVSEWNIPAGKDHDKALKREFKRIDKTLESNSSPAIEANAKKSQFAARLKDFKSLPLIIQKKNEQKSGKPELAPGDKSDLGVLLSGLGILLDITGVYVAFFTLEYFFVAFTLAGFVLGAIGLILGITGMSNYKKEKANGTKYTKTLVMSIISMALGAGAMIMGLVYTLIGLLVVSSF